MKKEFWKKIASLFLIFSITTTTVTPIHAMEVPKTDIAYMNDTFTTLQSTNYFDRLFDNPSISNVTEEDVLAFEKEYEKQQKQIVSIMSEDEEPTISKKEFLTEFARKKATLLTALYGLDSVQYALIEDGEITVSGGVGYNNKVKKEQVNTSTMYGIASISKIFTTTAIMQLVEEGKVDLNAPVTTYIKEFQMADERYKDITVKMLLNHSSGIQGGSLNNALLFNDTTTINHDTLLDVLKEQRLKANPGEYSVYCNDGFSLAEIIVERVSGQTFSEYIAEYVTKPLEMETTKTPQDKFDTTMLAGIYNGTTKLPIETFNAIGTGGIYSTAENLCQFSEVFMNSSNKSDILSNNSVVSMATRAEQANHWIRLESVSDGYGLGFDSVNAYPFDEYGIKALTKGGDSGFYHGSLIVLPEQNKAVAVLSSAGSSSIDQIFGSSILLQALYWDEIITEPFQYEMSYGFPEKEDIPSELLEYEGYYLTMGGILEIEMDPTGILTMKSCYAPENKTQLIYTGNGKFRDLLGMNELEFITEGNGKQYIWGGGYASLPTIGSYFSEYYQAYKIDNNIISEDVKDAWEKRENQLYFVIDEKYSSASYISGGLITQVVLSDEPEGYVGHSKIVDENIAISDITLPGTLGRDLQDYRFYTEDGIEYVKIHDFLAISGKNVKALSSKSKYNITIGKDGYAKWYKINSKTANKIMKVTLPEHGAFAVYDKNGICKTYSYVSNKKKIRLPKGGYVVFMGDANAKFTVKISDSK